MKQLPVCLLLLPFLVLSCNSQWKTSSPVKSPGKPESSVIELPKIKRPKGAEYIRFGEGLQDRAGHLWFATTGDGVYRFDGKSFTHYTTKDGLRDSIVNCLLEAKSGKILFGTERGISQWDGTAFSDYSEEADLNAKTISSLLEDREGNLWIGTRQSGVYRYDGKAFTNFLNDNANPYLPNANHQLISDMLQDQAGIIWFSSWNRGGAWRFDGKTFTQYLPRAGYYQQPVPQPGIGKPLAAHLPDAPVHQPGASIPDDMIFSLAEDKAGNIWFATRDHGACRFNGRTFTSFREPEGFVSRGIYSILEAKNGLLWLGTEYTGAWKYDGKSFVNYSIKDGLRNNSVFHILEDAAGNLWFSTRDFGLTRYDGKTFTEMTE